MENLAGASVVILEDEALIALDTEDQLRDAGFQVVGVFSSCDLALEWLETHAPDVAILDIDLRDGNCAPIAQVLYDRNTPFVVYSGSRANSDLNAKIFLQGIWVSKPCPPSDLRNAVFSALAMGQGDDQAKSGRAR